MRRIVVIVCLVMTTTTLCSDESSRADEPKSPQPPPAGVSGTTLPAPPVPEIGHTTALFPIDYWVTSEVRYVDTTSKFADYGAPWDLMTIEQVVPFDSSAGASSPFRYAAVEALPSFQPFEPSRRTSPGILPEEPEVAGCRTNSGPAASHCPGCGRSHQRSDCVRWSA